MSYRTCCEGSIFGAGNQIFSQKNLEGQTASKKKYRTHRQTDRDSQPDIHRHTQKQTNTHTHLPTYTSFGRRGGGSFSLRLDFFRGTSFSPSALVVEDAGGYGDGLLRVQANDATRDFTIFVFLVDVDGDEDSTSDDRRHHFQGNIECLVSSQYHLRRRRELKISRCVHASL